MIVFDPERDGIDHINVYSRAQTRLGRFLSNFEHSPIKTPDGVFSSLEGYWYWLRTGDERLRTLVGYDAKKLGKKLPRAFKFDVAKFKHALKLKVIHYKEYLDMEPLWSQLEIPLVHYYVYEGKPKFTDHSWVVEYLEDLRFHYS